MMMVGPKSRKCMLRRVVTLASLLQQCFVSARQTSSAANNLEHDLGKNFNNNDRALLEAEEECSSQQNEPEDSGTSVPHRNRFEEAAEEEENSGFDSEEVAHGVEDLHQLEHNILEDEMENSMLAVDEEGENEEDGPAQSLRGGTAGVTTLTTSEDHIENNEEVDKQDKNTTSNSINSNSTTSTNSTSSTTSSSGTRGGGRRVIDVLDAFAREASSEEEAGSPYVVETEKYVEGAKKMHGRTKHSMKVGEEEPLFYENDNGLQNQDPDGEEVEDGDVFQQHHKSHSRAPRAPELHKTFHKPRKTVVPALVTLVKARLHELWQHFRPSGHSATGSHGDHTRVHQDQDSSTSRTVEETAAEELALPGHTTPSTATKPPTSTSSPFSSTSVLQICCRCCQVLVLLFFLLALFFNTNRGIFVFTNFCPTVLTGLTIRKKAGLLQSSATLRPPAEKEIRGETRQEGPQRIDSIEVLVHDSEPVLADSLSINGSSLFSAASNRIFNFLQDSTPRLKDQRTRKEDLETRIQKLEQTLRRHDEEDRLRLQNFRMFPSEESTPPDEFDTEHMFVAGEQDDFDSIV
ncbi:unnamed protein product [Amoebophrya sp. A25]|nr:unnamed protein product [Amoebophrya sp. A25]|eukprot:GSA25T00008069001.1